MPVLELPFDLVDGVDDRGVVTAAEARADLRQRRLGEVARQVHGDLAGIRHLLRAAVAAQVVDVHAELARHLGLHGLYGDGVLVGLGQDVLQGLLGYVQGEVGAADGGEAHRPRERPVELTDVAGDARRDPLQHLGVVDLEALPLDLLAHDGDARLQVGAADVYHDALAEA